MKKAILNVQDGQTTTAEIESVDVKRKRVLITEQLAEIYQIDIKK